MINRRKKCGNCTLAPAFYFHFDFKRIKEGGLFITVQLIYLPPSKLIIKLVHVYMHCKIAQLYLIKLN